MANVWVPRDQIADGSLPSVCVADASHRLFPGVGAPSLAWVLFSPLRKMRDIPKAEGTAADPDSAQDEGLVRAEPV